MSVVTDSLVVVLIAGIGDVHGRWREAAATLVSACARVGIEPSDVAVILQVGDAQALRSEGEMEQVRAPARHRQLGDFQEVLSGAISFPAPVYFIAGNHEPFAALDADGGLVKGGGVWGPGVTYLGRVGVVDIAGLRVGFLSGIYGERTSKRPERGQVAPPREGKYAAHYTAGEVDALMDEISRAPLDILLTHDWPSGMGQDGHYGPVGDPNVRALVEAAGASASMHGHMHRAHRDVIGSTEIACLAIVGNTDGHWLDAVGLWDFDPVNGVSRLT